MLSRPVFAIVNDRMNKPGWCPAKRLFLPPLVVTELKTGRFVIDAEPDDQIQVRGRKPSAPVFSGYLANIFHLCQQTRLLSRYRLYSSHPPQASAARIISAPQPNDIRAITWS